MTIVWTIGDIIGITTALIIMAFLATWCLVALIANWFRKPPSNP